MKRLLQGLIAIVFLTLVVDTRAQVRISEVGYSGVDFMGASMWVELYNAGDGAVDVSGLWLCNFPAYSQISSLTVLEGATMLQSGDYLVVAFDALGDGDGEVGLYTSNQFGNAAAIGDYMQYGSAGHTREGVAVTAGLWTAGAFAAAPASGMSLAFTGTGATAAESWIEAGATPGASNPADHATAVRTSIDRFSPEAGNLFVRSEGNTLPGANAAINFDEAPFITRGFGPAGELIDYYNFDVQPTTPAPLYVLFRDGEDAPVAGQFNIVDVVPGDEGYNDFWQPVKVKVPADYVANTITSAEGLAGLPMEALDVIVNCPIVAEGSTATQRLNSANNAGLVNGWYKDEAVFYFEFGEAALAPVGGEVPLSPIYVTFNINPDQPNGGPPSGFVTEEGSAQTHNVLATLPGDEAYSPLWVVNIFDNADFGAVSDLASAQSATILVAGAANVNCPVARVEGAVAIEELTDETPTQFALRGNYPNPFNPTTTIRYELIEAGEIVLSVFNILGQQVAELVNGVQTAGVYEVRWDGRGRDGQITASGVYLYRVTLDGRQSQSRIMTLLK
jgi:FlgD Ig-like domain